LRSLWAARPLVQQAAHPAEQALLLQISEIRDLAG
jgi:hypothetical protein